MKVFITGISGFIGSHLCRKLLSEGCDIFGVALERPSEKNIRFLQGDLLELDLEKILGEFKPDVVFHLAAQSHVGQSWQMVELTHFNNFRPTLRLLEALASNKLKPVFVLASSAEVYGFVNERNQPIRETQPPAPVTHYGLSKLNCENLALLYWRVYGIKTIIVRLFNQIGPGQRPDFVASYFAKRIAEIEKEITKAVLEVGNLDARRDFTDIRDSVEALYLLTQKGKPGQTYNIGSGKVYSIKEILEILLSYSEKEIEVVVKRSRMRKKDISLLWASVEKLNSKTGWVPSIPIEKTLLDVLNYWRERV